MSDIYYSEAGVYSVRPRVNRHLASFIVRGNVYSPWGCLLSPPPPSSLLKLQYWVCLRFMYTIGVELKMATMHIHLLLWCYFWF